MSISNNIAEGFERGTTQELLTFLYISRGSAAESRSMLCFIERVPVFGDLKSEISDLKSQAEAFPANYELGPTLCRTRTSRVHVISPTRFVRRRRRRSGRSFWRN
ncbi:MAG: four helix bundle protein [Acidobacteria bacterium]|nr:four helix bundle protein [Acidobacteriota bacterium]MCI0720757.1 four helix bundle protein [Acidobacteriota bacterium]